MVKIRSKNSEGIFINEINNISQASWIFGLNVQFSTSVLQEFLKHARPDYLVKVTDFFSLTLLNKNNESSQHNSHLGWMNQKLYLFLSDGQKYIFFGVPQSFSNSFTCAVRGQRLKITVLSSGGEVEPEDGWIVRIGISWGWFREGSSSPIQRRLVFVEGDSKADPLPRSASCLPPGCLSPF